MRCLPHLPPRLLPSHTHPHRRRPCSPALHQERRLGRRQGGPPAGRQSSAVSWFFERRGGRGCSTRDTHTHTSNTTLHTHSDKKKADAVAARRAARSAPRVVALLPLSSAADAAAAAAAIVAGCCATEGEDTVILDAAPTAPVHLPPPARGVPALLLLPPLTDRSDPLAVVDLVKAADVLVLVVAADGGQPPIDGDGETAAHIARALGAPTTLAVATGAPSGDLKARSAAKKRAALAVASILPGREARTLCTGDRGDAGALARALTDTAAPQPVWRAPRAALLVEGASIDPIDGTLRLTGHVRGAGMAAAALVHVPGAGDFQIECVRSAPLPATLTRAGAPPAPPSTPAKASDTTMNVDAGGTVLATVPPDAREPLDREAAPPPDADAAWPTADDLDAVLYAAAAADRERARAAARPAALPAGTSDYQAAWFVEGTFGGGGSSCDDDDDNDDHTMAPPGAAAADAACPALMDASDDDEDDRLTDGATDAADADAAAAAAAKAAYRAATDDAAWPDEVDAPPDVPARVRFVKYRGLAPTWRAAEWHAADGAPAEYGRVFAFESARRARTRAVAAAAAAGAPGGPPGVPAGTRVEVALAGVPADAAAAVVARALAAATGAAAPLTATALLQHEGRLSVMHYALRKASTYAPPIRGKDELLFVTGVRSHPVRAIFSSDDHGASKFKLDRFLQPGRPSIASAYAPIAHGPLPVLAFAKAPGGGWSLAATGGVRGADPDRVILKKAVLTGYPVKVHKRKAVVRWMFHSADDVRWFAPVEVWTKAGRRGRVREPVGTHGAMKCVFDGGVVQTDAVCMSLFKRAAPPWPPGDVWTG